MAMSGLLGAAKLMASLADVWSRHLDAKHPGRIAYFKLDDALTLNGEFRHWQEHNRDAKIRQMASVVDREDVLQIAAVIDIDAYERILGPWEDYSEPCSLNHPYLMLCEYVLVTCVTEAVKRGETERSEVVYD